MKKLINWLKDISKDSFVQKFYLIAFIAFCGYLIIPKWQISHQDNGTVAVNKFTGEVQGENLREQITNLQHQQKLIVNENFSCYREIGRLQKRVNELVDFIKAAEFKHQSNSEFDSKHSVSLEKEVINEAWSQMQN